MVFPGLHLGQSWNCVLPPPMKDDERQEHGRNQYEQKNGQKQRRNYLVIQNTHTTATYASIFLNQRKKA